MPKHDKKATEGEDEEAARKPTDSRDAHGVHFARLQHG